MKIRRVVQIALAFTVLIFSNNTVRADWINLTGAETARNIAKIYIEDDRVQLRLEMFIGDLKIVRDLMPDDMLSDGALSRPPLLDRLERFSGKMLAIQWIANLHSHVFFRFRSHLG